MWIIKLHLQYQASTGDYLDEPQCRKCQQSSLSSNVGLRKVSTQYQENDNTACYQMQNKPFSPTPRPDTASEEEMLCPDRSLCISSFDPVGLGFGGENPNEFRSAPGPAHREGCYNVWCHLFPQHPTAPDSTLGSPNSIFHLFRAGDVWEDWGSCASVGLLYTWLHTSQASKGHTQRAAGWSHAAGTHLSSDIWSARLLKMDKFTKCITKQAWSRNCVQAPAFNNLLLNAEGWNSQWPVITVLKGPAERKTFGSQNAPEFWLLLVGFVQTVQDFEYLTNNCHFDFPEGYHVWYINSSWQLHWIQEHKYMAVKGTLSVQHTGHTKHPTKLVAALHT